MHRSPSPTRRHRFDHHSHNYADGPGFSDTVSNVVEIQRHTHHPHSTNHRRKLRGTLFSARTIQCLVDTRCNTFFFSFFCVMRYTDYYDHCDYYDDGNLSSSNASTNPLEKKRKNASIPVLYPPTVYNLILVWWQLLCHRVSENITRQRLLCARDGSTSFFTMTLSREKFLRLCWAKLSRCAQSMQSMNLSRRKKKKKKK